MNPEVSNSRSNGNSELERLDSWKQIAAYLERSERTVRRWEQTEGLPVHRHVHQQRGSVWAYKKDLDEWLVGRRLSPETLEPPEDKLEQARHFGPSGIRAGAAIAAISLVTIILVAIIAVGWNSRKASAIHISEPVPLTSLPGTAYGPAFSPDGRQVAFFWSAGYGGNPGIYLKSIGSETLTPLTTNKPTEGKFTYGPAWSPDGRTIAFLRRHYPQPRFDSLATESETWLCLIAASGGPERRLIRLATNVVFYANNTHLSWTPNSQWIVAPMSDGKQRGIHRISAATGEALPITNGQEFGPLLSPDGRALVFLRREGPGLAPVEQVLRQNLTVDGNPQGPPLVLSKGRSISSGLAWTPSGKELIYCTADNAFVVGPSTSQLYRLSAEAAGPLVSLGLGGCSTVAISPPDGSGRAMMVYASSENSKARLWQADLSALHRATPLAPSSRFDGLPSYSPDGSFIAFMSNRSGQAEVWVTNRNGTGAKKITEGSHIASIPRWSPDGRLVYGAAMTPQEVGPRSAPYGVYIVPIAGGATSRVPLGMQSASDPSWSPDGQWIYYWSDSQLWRARIDGTGSVLVGEYPARFVRPGISDGGSIYYIRPGKPFALCRAAVETRTEEVLEDQLLTPFFAVTQKFVYFVKQIDQTLYALPRAGGPVRRIGSIPQLESRMILGISVSQDDASVVWGVSGERQIDLQLVRDFR